jgi:hypothetical protein
MSLFRGSENIVMLLRKLVKNTLIILRKFNPKTVPLPDTWIIHCYVHPACMVDAVDHWAIKTRNMKLNIKLVSKCSLVILCIITLPTSVMQFC